MLGRILTIETHDESDMLYAILCKVFSLTNYEEILVEGFVNGYANIYIRNSYV